MSTLREFINHVRQKGVARTNRFRITFGFPVALTEKISRDPTGSFADGFLRNPPTFSQLPNTSDLSGRSLSVMAQAVSIPGYNIQMSELKAGTLMRRFPQGKTFGELDITFISSGDMNERKLFDEWIKIVVNDRAEVGFYDDIVTDATIEVLNDQGTVVYRTNALEIYPIVVTPVSLNRSDKDTYQTFQTTFNFWKLETNDDVIQKFDPMSGQVVDAEIVTGERTVFGIPAGNIKKGTGIWKMIEGVKRDIERGVEPEDAIRILRRLQDDISVHGTLPDASEAQRDIEDLIWVLRR